MIRSLKLRAQSAQLGTRSPRPLKSPPAQPNVAQEAAGSGGAEPNSGVDLDSAFALCLDITRHHSKSFFFSTAFLPPAKRAAIRAFYAFCRTTDDMVDVLAQSDAEKYACLEAWRQDARLPTDEQHNPVMAAWTHTKQTYGVPQGYAEELIDGCEMDLTVKRYATWAELEHYCYCVASTVGLISMHIIGVSSDDESLFTLSQPPAIELGIALQLTNILRDVGEDLSRDRIYLPQEDMRRFGYTEDDLKRCVIDDRFRALMHFEIERAQTLYRRGLPSIANLKSDGRLAVGAAIMLYRAILDKIIDNDFDVFQKRAHLTLAEKLGRMPRIAWQVWKPVPSVRRRP